MSKMLVSKRLEGFKKSIKNIKNLNKNGKRKGFLQSACIELTFYFHVILKTSINRKNNQSTEKKILTLLLNLLKSIGKLLKAFAQLK